MRAITFLFDEFYQETVRDVFDFFAGDYLIDVGTSLNYYGVFAKKISEIAGYCTGAEIPINSQRELLRINTANIVFFESLRHEIKVHIWEWENNPNSYGGNSNGMSGTTRNNLNSYGGNTKAMCGAMRNYPRECNGHCIRTKKIISTFDGPLKKYEERLSYLGFARASRSYLLSLKYVVKIKGKDVYMEDGAVIKLGRTYEESFMEQYRKFYRLPEKKKCGRKKKEA